MNQEKQKAKTYSAEFRESSVKLALDSDLPIAQTARDLGINPNTLHTWIKEHVTEFSVITRCRFMGVSGSAYYAWLERSQTAIEKDDVELIEPLRPYSKRVERTNYGTRRLKKALTGLNWHVSRRRIGRLMGAAGLTCRTKGKFKATTNSNHNLPIAPNHLAR
jgi:putative transposase